jgi:hypothetical protein
MACAMLLQSNEQSNVRTIFEDVVFIRDCQSFLICLVIDGLVGRRRREPPASREKIYQKTGEDQGRPFATYCKEAFSCG